MTWARELHAQNLHALQLGIVNVILGRNGCGKSSFLKGLDAVLGSETGSYYVRYITPERGGKLDYDPNVGLLINQDAQWMGRTRRANRFDSFRQQTIYQYRALERLASQALEDAVQNQKTDAKQWLFQKTIDRINELLDHVEIRRSINSESFVVHSKATGDLVSSDLISSGETELISLAIETLAFAGQCRPDVTNLLLLDEPDVHLHPDLQARLMALLVELVHQAHFTLIVATHSTPVVAALSAATDSAIAFMQSDQKELRFQPMSEVMRRVVPIFGAHPLSNVFNEAPVLILEGEDDVRIWQQAVRTSQGKLRVYPVASEGLPSMPEYEQVVRELVDSLYDNPVAYSLRDRDGGPEEIDDLLPLVRCRLSCRTAENLLLTDEVIASTEAANWDEVRRRIDAWLATGLPHTRRQELQDFAAGGYDRKGAALKNLRMLLVGEMMGSTKPWEVLVGGVLGKTLVAGPITMQKHSIGNYLGEKTVSCLLA